MRIPLALLLAVGGLVAADPPTRDPWLWPFAATSIWNQPIGSAAVYKPAGFQAAGHVGVDTQHILALSASDPLRQCFLSTTFGPGRDEGTESIDFWLRLPDAWLVPDAGSSPYGSTPNSNYALRRWGAESDLVQEGCMITRTTVGGPFFLPDYVRWPANRDTQSITGDGLQGGGQGASGMSALGGTLRRGELTGSAPIRHAIKVNPWAARYCHYSTAVPGWKWPARSADGYAASTYNRNADPAIVMGSLFAIPPAVTAQSLGLTTAPGRKLFAAMQDYGVYFTDDAAWDTWDLVVERYAADDFAQQYGFSMESATWKAEVNRLMQALSVITNNAPGSIGGGGTPRQPLAPPFAGANTAPAISSIAAQTTTVGAAKTVAFTVGDAETAAASLSVAKASSDTVLLPLSGIVFGGSGANRTVTLTPAATRIGTATVTVTVGDAGGLTASRSFVLTVTALPAGFASQDVGSTSPAGTAVGDGSSFTISGAGADIWGQADACRYVWQGISGNADIVVRVDALTGTDAWAKAGIMVRESTAAGSRHVSLFATPANGVAFQFRSQAGGSSAHVAGPNVMVPTWLRLSRSGSNFTASQSSDGTTWKVVGARTVAIPSNALVGLAVTSHKNGSLATARFSQFQITPTASN